MANSTLNGRLALLGLAAATLLAAENTPARALLALSKTDRTLSIVDPVSLKVIARLPSGPDPHEVIASGDGRLAFISNYGGGAYNTLTVVDLIAQRPLPAVDLGPLNGPHGLAFAGGKVWFTAEAAKVIGSYDPVAKKVDTVIGTGQNRTHMIFVTADVKRIITSNVSSATMTFIDKIPGRPRGPGGPPGVDWDETVIPVGRGAEGFDVSPDGKEIWAANALDGTISVVDLAGKRVTETLAAANVASANRLKFTPDGKLVLVSMLRAPEVAVFDAATRKEVRRVKVGSGAAGILMHPDGSTAYVACTPDSYVAIIDLKTLEVTGHLDAGKQPDGLAWAVQP